MALHTRASDAAAPRLLHLWDTFRAQARALPSPRARCAPREPCVSSMVACQVRDPARRAEYALLLASRRAEVPVPPGATGVGAALAGHADVRRCTSNG